MKKEKEKRKNVKKMFALMFVALLTFTGWGCKRTAGPTDTGLEEQTNEGIIEETTEEPEIPAGWKEYRNEELGFKFQYPDEWQLRVVNETPFTWENIEYEVIDIQLLDPESGQYIGAYSFAITENSERLPLAEWLSQHNTVNDPFILVDEPYNETVPGKKFTYPPEVTLNLDQQAYPAGSLVFSDPENAHIFFPDLGQDHSIFEIYNISADDFASQIRTTFRFIR